MIIYKDLFTDDELFSDIYKIELVDDVVYKIEGKLVTEKDSIDDSLFGANASAEGEDADAGGDTNAVSGVNIVLASKLQQTNYAKKDYGTYIKGYMKRVLEKLQESNPDRVEVFKKNMQAFVKTVLGNYKEYDLYTGESMNPDGMVVLLEWVDGDKPTLYFFKDGCVGEKV